MVGTEPSHTDLPNWSVTEHRAGYDNARELADLARRRALEASPERRIERVGICGAGIMGAGIATACVQHQIPVSVYDAAPVAVERTVEQLRSAIDSGTVRDAKCVDSATAASLAVACARQEDLQSCDLIVETVVENRELKQKILGELGGKLPPSTILTSNTSTIPIRELAATLPAPHQFCGLHFCNPVSQRRLVEIVRGPQTDSNTLTAAVNFAARIGKLPIVVEDRPGFLVNRLLLPYLNEALEMLCQGVAPTQLDQTARSFGMALGPIELFDLIGTDTAMWAGRTLWEAFPDRIAITPVLPALVKRNRLGQKTALGFYRYEQDNRRPIIDPELDSILAPYIRNARPFTAEEITLRLFLPMLVEATRLLDETVVQDTRDVDIGVLYGLAFPQARGGLLYWADELGARTIVDLLKPFAHLGKRMHATERLLRMAQSGTRFYGELRAER